MHGVYFISNILNVLKFKTVLTFILALVMHMLNLVPSYLVTKDWMQELKSNNNDRKKNTSGEGGKTAINNNTDNSKNSNGIGNNRKVQSFFNECGDLITGLTMHPKYLIIELQKKRISKSGLTGKIKKTVSQNSMVNTNNSRYCRNIDANKISKVTYNVKKGQECAEMVKVKMESKDGKEIAFKKLVRKKTKEKYLNIAF